MSISQPAVRVGSWWQKSISLVAGAGAAEELVAVLEDLEQPGDAAGGHA